jgi:hypothetical protein
VRIHGLVSPAALLLALGILPGLAEAAFCAKRSGAIVFRPGACRKREAQLEAARVGVPVGPPGEKGDAGDGGPRPGLNLIDAAGNRVGGFVTSDGDEFVFLRSPLEGRILRMTVRRPRFADQRFNLYHEGPNCGGPAFLPGLPGRLYSTATQWRGKVYYPGDPTDAAAREYASYERPEDPCPAGTTPTADGFCCHNEPTTFAAAPVRTFEAALLPTGPFAVVP